MLPPLYKLHFSSHTKATRVASTVEKDDQCSTAVAIHRKQARGDELVNIRVSYDRAWSKHGYQGI